MKYRHNLAVILNGMWFLYTRAAASNGENFQMKINLGQEKLQNYLSRVLCSIDVKYVKIIYEFETEATLLDGIITENSGCIHPSVTIISQREKTADILTSTNHGSHLLIFLMNDVEFKNSLFPTIFHTRSLDSFNLFYMIVSQRKLSAEHEHLLKELYSRCDVLNAVVVAMDSVDSDLSVITHNPFVGRTTRLPPNTAYTREALFVEKNVNLFGNSLNFIIYKDTVPTSRSSAKEIDLNFDAFLPDYISLSMNATPILKTPYTENAAFDDVRNMDLIINAKNYPLNTLKPLGIERALTLRRDDIRVLVPYNRSYSTFDRLVKIVSPYVWILMFVVIVSVWSSFYTTRWTERYEVWKRPFLLDVFAFHMNQPLTKLPKVVVLRLIIASCLLYCLVITSVFMGALYTSMSMRKDVQVATLRELLEINQQELLVGDEFYKYSEHYLKLFSINKHLHVIDFIEFIKRVESNQLRYAYVSRSRTIKYFENTQIDERQPVYYVLKETIVPLMSLYLVREGSPFLSRINFLLRLAEETGLFRYNEEQLNQAYHTLNQGQRLFMHQTAGNLEHLEFVFQIWGYGLVLATAIFVIERLTLTLNNWIIARRCRK